MLGQRRRYAIEEFARIIIETKRRFRILDAVIFTASIAFAFAACRAIAPNNYSPGSRFEVVFYLRTIALTLTWSLGSLIVFDSMPLRDAARSWGKLCILLICAMSILPLLRKWYIFFLFEEPLSERLLAFFHAALLDSDVFMPAYATIAAWLTLWLLSIDDSSRDWMAALGRVIGIFWVICMLTRNVLYSYEDILSLFA